MRILLPEDWEGYPLLKDYKMPATIDDPAILDEIKVARRAVISEEIETEYTRLKAPFGVVESDAVSEASLS